MQTLPFIDLGGVWHITYFVGLACILPIAISVWGQPLPLSAKILWGYLLLWCLFLIEYPRPHFGQYTPNFQATAAQIGFEAVFIPFAVMRLGYIIEKIIPYLAAFAAVSVWFKYPGLMHASSFNMALAAVCIPAITNPLLIAAIVITALFHHGSTALLIIASQTLAGVLRGRYGKRVLTVLIPVMILSAYLLQNQPMFNSGERIQKWNQYITFWAQDPKRMIFGAGPGSFIWYSILTYPYQTGLFLQMHCDYLEIGWALGLLGLGLAGLLLVDAIKRAWTLPVSYFQGLLGCLAFMLTYEPLEYFPTALLIAWFFSRVLIVERVDFDFAGLVWPVKSDDA